MATSHHDPEAQQCKCSASNPGSLPKKIYNAAEEGKIADITEWLKTPSVNVNSASLLNRTVLHFACLGDQPKVIEVIMMYNVCLNIRDNAGETPLMIASKKGHKLCVQLLLKSKSNSRGGGCAVDIDALTKYSEKTALNLAQDELERNDKEKVFQDIVKMLRKRTSVYASTNSISKTMNIVNEEPAMVEPGRNRGSVTESDSLLLDASAKSSLVTRIRDGIQERSKLLWKQTKSFFSTHFSLLLDLSPWVMQLFLALITLYLVTGYQSNIGFDVPCNTTHNITVMSTITYPLNLYSVQHVAKGCNNSNQIMDLRKDFSAELYFVTVVASMTCATLIWTIVYHANKEYEEKNLKRNILYVDIPVLSFNSFFWLCASCDLAVAITNLKEVLHAKVLSKRNAHFCEIFSCIKDFNVTGPYTVPLDFGCFFGFVIFFSGILYSLRLVIKYKRHHN